MNKAVLIIGLPGSGKTHLAKTKYVPLGYTLIDDPTELPKIDKVLFKDIVVTDPHLCDERIRNNCIYFFENFGYTVECIYFENNEEKCRRLLKYRNDERVITTFKPFNYTIPSNVTPLTIWNGEL